MIMKANKFEICRVGHQAGDQEEMGQSKFKSCLLQHSFLPRDAGVLFHWGHQLTGQGPPSLQRLQVSKPLSSRLTSQTHLG